MLRQVIFAVLFY